MFLFLIMHIWMWLCVQVAHLARRVSQIPWRYRWVLASQCQCEQHCGNLKEPQDLITTGISFQFKNELFCVIRNLFVRKVILINTGISWDNVWVYFSVIFRQLPGFHPSSRLPPSVAFYLLKWNLSTLLSNKKNGRHRLSFDHMCVHIWPLKNILQLLNVQVPFIIYFSPFEWPYGNVGLYFRTSLN